MTNNNIVERGTEVSLTPPDSKAAACPIDKVDRLIVGAMLI